MNWKDKKKWMIDWICDYISKTKLVDALTGDYLTEKKKQILIKDFQSLADDNIDHQRIYEAFAHYKYGEYYSSKVK